MKLLVRSSAAAVLVLASIGQGRADTILGELWENQTSDATDALIANAPSSAPDAKFNPGAINYNSGVGGYTIGGYLNSPTFFDTSATFKPSDTVDNVYFLFTGSTFLNAGANKFVTPHDDGFELSIPGAFSDSGMTTPFDFKQPGPTAPVSTPYTVYAPTSGDYSFTLAYGECCGPPAVLEFSVNDVPVGSAPEPASLAVCGLGLLGMAGYRWGRRKTQKA